MGATSKFWALGGCNKASYGLGGPQFLGTPLQNLVAMAALPPGFSELNIFQSMKESCLVPFYISEHYLSMLFW
jgi:hypothetical protein